MFKIFNSTPARTRGFNWAKKELAGGTPVEDIEGYLNGSDDFDLGARDFLWGLSGPLNKTGE